VGAICINQNDLDERADQVKQMRRIYAKARKVIVWIQEALPYAVRAIRLLQEVVKIWPPQAPHRDEKYIGPNGVEFYEVMENLFQRPYIIMLLKRNLMAARLDGPGVGRGTTSNSLVWKREDLLGRPGMGHGG